MAEEFTSLDNRRTHWTARAWFQVHGLLTFWRQPTRGELLSQIVALANAMDSDARLRRLRGDQSEATEQLHRYASELRAFAGILPDEPDTQPTHYYKILSRTGEVMGTSETTDDLAAATAEIHFEEPGAPVVEISKQEYDELQERFDAGG